MNIQKLGWVLLHFLWQGTAIAVIYGVLRALTGKALSARGRYALACLTLITMTIAPPLTYLLLPDNGEALPAIPLDVSLDAWQRILPSFVAVWLAGVLVFSIRLLGGWRFTLRLQSASHDAPPEWQRTLEAIGDRVKTSSPVRLLISPLVEVPTVIGWLRPAILLPMGALTGLPAEHIAALLAHELAHIRRHDYIANILQSVAEALLFYHPAVWWVSEQIRAERELCCDDIAVAANGDVLTYARALARLESIQPPRMKTALAANGGSLLNRVRRLIDPAHPAAENLPAAGAAWTMMLLWLAGVGVATIHAAQTPGILDPIRALARPLTLVLPMNPAQNPADELANHARKTLLFDPLLPARAPQGASPSQGENRRAAGDGQSTTPQVPSPEIENPNKPDLADNRVAAQTMVPAPPASLVLAALSSPALPNPPAMPTLRAEARVVQIEVSVRDGSGRPVTNLGKRDFIVLDAGTPRALDIFSADAAAGHDPAATAPAIALTRAGEGLPPTEFSNRKSTSPPSGRSTAIVVDHRNEGWNGVNWARQNVLDLINRGLPDERIALYAIAAQGLELVQDYTADRELLLKSMREYAPGHVTLPPGAISNGMVQRFGPSLAIPVAVGRPAELQSPEITYGISVRNTINSLARPDEQPYEDTVEDVRLSLRALAEHLSLVPGRKSVFWVSAGFRPRTMAGAKWSESEDWRRTITALNEADIAVNVIDTIDDPRPTWSENRLVMKQIACETGARVWSARSGEALADGIEDSRATYTLGFYLPEGERDSKFHPLQVRVNRPGLQLSYRQGYYAGATDMPDPATEKGHTAETLETALLNQVDSRAIGITALVDVTPGNPHGTVNFRLNLDPGTLSLKERNDGWKGNVEEVFLELNEQGRTLARVSDKKAFEFTAADRSYYESKGITWPLSGPLVQGATRIAIIVRDTNSGRVGSLSVPLQ